MGEYGFGYCLDLDRNGTLAHSCQKNECFARSGQSVPVVAKRELGSPLLNIRKFTTTVAAWQTDMLAPKSVSTLKTPAYSGSAV